MYTAAGPVERSLRRSLTKNMGKPDKSDRDRKGRTFKPFPKELRTADKPQDTTKPKVIDGKEYWWCDTHDKWGSHSNTACRKRQSTSKATPAAGGDDRKARALRAVQALLQDSEDSDGNESS